MHIIKHADFSILNPTEIDLHHKLLAELLLTPSSAVKNKLLGQIDRTLLAPELLLAFSTIIVIDPFTAPADGTGQVFALSGTPLPTTTLVFVNGQKQRSSTDFTLAGASITFVRDLRIGDSIDVRYHAAQATATVVLGTFTLPYQNVFQVEGLNGFLYTYGDDKITPFDKTFAKIDPISFAQSGPAINVESGLPDNSAIVNVAGKLWVIGSPSTAINNRVIQVDPVTMTVLNDLEIVPSTDTTAVIAALATDGAAFFYAYIKGGVVAPHQIAKLDPNGTPLIPGTILTGLSPSSIGSIDMEVSQSGHLFLLFSSLNGGDGEVRKFDTGDGSLVSTFTEFTTPIKIIRVEDKMYVIDSATNKLWSIPSTGVPTDLVTFLATPTDIEFDGSDIWVSFGQDLVKMKKDGSTLTSISPVVAGLTIQDVSFTIGHIWTTYSNDTTDNMTKIFPGLAGS